MADDDVKSVVHEIFEELVGGWGLPEELVPVAMAALPIVEKMAFDEIQPFVLALVDKLTSGGADEGERFILSKMDLEDVIAYHVQANHLMRSANKKNFEMLQRQREILNLLIMIGLMALKTKLGD